MSINRDKVTKEINSAASDRLAGLTSAQVLESRKLHGSNVVTPPEREPWWRKLLGKFADPLIVILLIAGVMSVCISLYEYFALGGGTAVFFEPVGIFVAILLATVLAFAFEQQAENEFAILNQVNDDEPVMVRRDGQVRRIAKRDVVVGDLVVLSTGQEVPADALLLQSTSLSIDESSLTGEPICRKSVEPADQDPDATYPTNEVMRGTKVMEGHGLCRVQRVGDATEIGKVQQAAQIDDSVRTPLSEQLDRLGRLVSNFSYTVAGAIIVGKLVYWFDWAWQSWLLVLPTALFFYCVIAKFHKWGKKQCLATIVSFFAIFIGCLLWLQTAVPEIAQAHSIDELMAYGLQTVMIAVALIVVAVPEGLPMAVTLSLAYSMRRMLKTNNLVRKLHACETMGATTVICTDKTGTLTQNQMRVASTRFYGLGDEQSIAGNQQQQVMIAEALAACSTASLDVADATHATVLGNPTEGALLLWLHEQGHDYEALRNQARVLHEVPFSTERKYMAVEVQSAMVPGQRILYVKGASEILFTRCQGIEGGTVTREQVLGQLEDFQRRAMRTLGFACKVLAPGEVAVSDGELVATGLTFMGIVAINDPVRPDVPHAVREVQDAGIAVKVVTGDTPITAREIAREIGLWTDADGDDAIITGPEFAQLTPEQLDQRADKIKIIASARPMDKKRLVEALQAKGHVVAVTGDGTNDAPALKAAHVGLSMGDGTSVAKEASDITIIDNSFASIGRAVMWGRSLYQNIQRFILFQLTVNVAACLVVLAGAFMGTKSPLTVTQMLWVNLIMDTFAAMALASLPNSERVMRDKPRDRNAFIITRPMCRRIIGVGGAFSVLLIMVLFALEHDDVRHVADLPQMMSMALHNWVHLSTGQYQGLFDYESNIFFTTFVLLQFWNLFNARAFATGRSALHRLQDCKGFLLILAIILVGQMLINQFAGSFFNLEPLGWDEFFIIFAATSVVLVVGEIVRLFRR